MKFDWIVRPDRRQDKVPDELKRCEFQAEKLFKKIAADRYKIERALEEMNTFVEREFYEEAARIKDAITRTLKVIDGKKARLEELRNSLKSEKGYNESKVKMLIDQGIALKIPDIDE